MQYRVFVKQPEEKQLDCQTFKGYAFRRACDFQLGYLKDGRVKKEAARLAKGSTNEEAFNKLKAYLDEVDADCVRVYVEPYQREKTAEELLRERQVSDRAGSTPSIMNTRISIRNRRRTGLKYIFDWQDTAPPPVQREHGGPPLSLEYESTDEGSSEDNESSSGAEDQVLGRNPSLASVLSRIRRGRRRRRRVLLTDEDERPVKIRRAPLFIPFEALKPRNRPRCFPSEPYFFKPFYVPPSPEDSPGSK